MSESATPEPHPFERFKAAMKHLITVPKTEILRREEEYRKQRAELKKQKSKTP